MKTKIVVASVALGVCVWPVGADEKNAKPSAPPPALRLEPQNRNPRTDDQKIASPFVIPVPKDQSDFTMKPPEGGMITIIPNPQGGPLIAPPSGYAPRLRTMPPMDSYLESLRVQPKWQMKNAPLSMVLETISKTHNAKIVACFAPEKLQDDPKITMRLDGKTAGEKLDNLKVLGLVWRKIGETYFVAWSETDLPPLQK